MSMSDTLISELSDDTLISELSDEEWKSLVSEILLKCVKCGNCCIVLAVKEIDKAKDERCPHLIDTDVLIEESRNYMINPIGRTQKILEESKDGVRTTSISLLLTERLCNIHEDKPEECRNFFGHPQLRGMNDMTMGVLSRFCFIASRLRRISFHLMEVEEGDVI